MFHYDLKGKQVILQLDPEFLPHLRFAGVDGSPVLAKVHRMEEHGLWLATDSFALCPVGVPALYRPSGRKACRAHIFIPAKAVLSVVVFPGQAPSLEKEPGIHTIGFKPPKE